MRQGFSGLRRLFALLAAFRADTGGQILALFALSSIGIFAGVGAGVDLSTAYAARQRLSQVATLTCQYSTRPSVAQTANITYGGPNGFQNYLDTVNAFATATLTGQHWSAGTPTGTGGATGGYFTATAPAGGTGGTASNYVPSNPVVEMSAQVATNFGQVLGVSSVTVHARIACQNLVSTPQVVNPPVLLSEGFETPCTTFCSTQARGTSFTTRPSNTFPATSQFAGDGGTAWYIMGYCLEVDAVGTINSTVRQGTHSAELDCDNGQGSAGNSSLSTKLYLEGGSYEIRYFYRARIDYPDYDPAYICGTTAGDVSFANSSNSVGGARANVVRTNQINVYLDQNRSDNTAPLHTTIDGTQQLAGANLIDTCVYSPTWVERSIRISVSTPAYYWLSFAADGENDSYGGQIDYIRVCQATCPGTPQDNFPTAWAPSGSVNKVLFQDTFEAPTYSSNASQPSRNTNGNPAQSTGTSGTSSSGWPSQSSSGWQVFPSNQVTVNMPETGHGQFLYLDGVGGSTTNRIMARQFLLMPGYYRVSYDYVSEFTGYFAYNNVCFEPPFASSIYPATAVSATTTVSGTLRNSTTTVAAKADTNFLSAFMGDTLLTSAPSGRPVGSNQALAAQGAATGWFNPGNTTDSVATPSVWPDDVNVFAYTTSATSPMISTCGYTSVWTTRNPVVKITKPGLYLLTFSAKQGTADGYGPGLDNVTLTALGSPYMSSPPTAALTQVPNPSPVSDSSYTVASYSGFTVTADPFTPPGAAP